MLKKLTLLAMAVGALVAFAAPSMASGAEWYTSGTALKGSTAEGDAVHFTGTLSSTKSGLKITCEATANTTLWNENGSGVGEATLTLSGTTAEGCTVAVFVNPIYVDLAKCHVNPTATGFNWPVSTNGSTVAIAKVEFHNEFVGEDCKKLGLQPGTVISDHGTVIGTFSGGSITFANSGNLATGSLIDGTLSPTTAGLELK